MNSQISVLETDNIRITCYDPQHPNLVVSFDHRRLNRDGFPAPMPSEFFAANNRAFLTIHSARNDWFLSPDLPQIKQTLFDFTERFEHIKSIGFSMGGYGALLLSRALRTNRVLLISPQSSIFPHSAPFEDRYQSEAKALNPVYDDLGQNPRRGLRGLILYDPNHRIDTAHAKRILGFYPKLTPVPMPFAGHHATTAISEANLFSHVQQEMLRNQPRARAFLAMHKTARKTAPAYQENLAAYLKQRKERK